MESLISLIIFSIPGLLVYFWLQAFGINPTVKHLATEQASIAALFWIPTVFITILTYNFLYWIIDKILKFIGMDFSFFKLMYVWDITGIASQSTNIIFIMYFFILSLFYSYLVALIWSRYIFYKLLKVINGVRKKRGLSELDDTTSVWDAYFLKFNERDNQPMVVMINKIDKPDEPPIIGSATKYSRPYETDRGIVLENIKNNTESHDYYKYEVKRKYIDIKSGLIISELDTTSPTENIEDFISFLEEGEVEQQDD